MPDYTITVYFSETEEEIFPTVNDGFCSLCGLKKGQKIKFKFDKKTYDQWRSQASDPDLSQYTISLKVPEFAYKLKLNDNDPVGDGPDEGDYDLIAKDGVFFKADGDAIEVVKVPKKWDGIESEYDITVTYKVGTPEEKSGTLDPRARGRHN